MSHRFSLDQSVTFLASTFEASASSGRYTISQLLPAELGEYQYTVRHERTGELRRAREAQLKPFVALVPPLKPSAKRPHRRPIEKLAAGAAH